jgi:hypothetical protein
LRPVMGWSLRKGGERREAGDRRQKKTAVRDDDDRWGCLCCGVLQSNIASDWDGRARLSTAREACSEFSWGRPVDRRGCWPQGGGMGLWFVPGLAGSLDCGLSTERWGRRPLGRLDGRRRKPRRIRIFPSATPPGARSGLVDNVSGLDCCLPSRITPCPRTRRKTVWQYLPIRPPATRSRLTVGVFARDGLGE